MNKPKQSKHKNFNDNLQQIAALKKGLNTGCKQESPFGTKEFAAFGKGREHLY